MYTCTFLLCVFIFLCIRICIGLASVSSCVGALRHDGVHGCISTHFDVYLHTLIYIYIYVIYALCTYMHLCIYTILCIHSYILCIHIYMYTNIFWHALRIHVYLYVQALHLLWGGYD